jgi:hypothetical protein
LDWRISLRRDPGRGSPVMSQQLFPIGLEPNLTVEWERILLILITMLPQGLGMIAQMRNAIILSMLFVKLHCKIFCSIKN